MSQNIMNIVIAIDTTQKTSKPKEPEQNVFSTRQACQRSTKKAEKHLP